MFGGKNARAGEWHPSLTADIRPRLQQQSDQVIHAVQAGWQIAQQGVQWSTAVGVAGATAAVNAGATAPVSAGATDAVIAGAIAGGGKRRPPIARTVGRLQPMLEELRHRQVNAAVG